ncbi:hypothetical protein THTE_1817 [Thermogutta terrifontis]|uniref:Uncharacterized protein n=1 Tax=Thermogutta terrifontis TaxID=1331910 RepID=A0A286REM8_9BACT|nr:hypothetical protein THTE_1817 [Thermogutta terrifontis]
MKLSPGYGSRAKYAGPTRFMNRPQNPWCPWHVVVFYKYGDGSALLLRVV